MRSSFRDLRQACALLLFPRSVCALLAEFSRPIWSGKNRMTEVADYRFQTHGMEVEPFVKGNAKVQTYKGAYISITDKCNTDICTYCYARDQQSGHKAPMSLSDFRRALICWGNSDFPEVYLVGGEPSTVRNILDSSTLSLKKWGATLYTTVPSATGCAMHSRGIRAFSAWLCILNRHCSTLMTFRRALDRDIRVLSRAKMLSAFRGCERGFRRARPLDLAEEFGLKLTSVFAAPSSADSVCQPSGPCARPGLVWSGSFC